MHDARSLVRTFSAFQIKITLKSNHLSEAFNLLNCLTLTCFWCAMFVLWLRPLQVSQCRGLSLSWSWLQTLPPPTCPPGEDVVFFEGPLLKVLFDRLGRILEQVRLPVAGPGSPGRHGNHAVCFQPYELNLQLTAVLSRLSAFDHPLLDEYLLNPYIHLSHCCRSLFSILVRVRQMCRETGSGTDRQVFFRSWKLERLLQVFRSDDFTSH